MMGHGITCQGSRNKYSRTRRVALFHMAARISRNLQERNAIDDKTFVKRQLSSFARRFELQMVNQDAPELLNPGNARGRPGRVAASRAPCLSPARAQLYSALDDLRNHLLCVLDHVFFCPGARKPRQRQSRPS